MSNILLIFLCLGIGFLFQKKSIFPKNTSSVLNMYVLYIALPCMALYYLPKITLGWDLLLPASVAWISFGLAFIFFNILGKIFNWSRRLIGCLILTAGLGNTSFVGIPIIEALFGEDALKTLIIIDLPGTFVTMSTLGIIVATSYSKQKSENENLTKKIFSFPPLIAFIIGITLALLKIDFPEVLSNTLKQIAATLSPIALVSVGFQLKIKTYGKHFSFLIIGLIFKLIIIPSTILFFFYFVLGKTDITTQVSIIEAAMPPMITGAILAQNYGLKPELSNMMVGYGIPISFITIGIWYYFITYII